MQYLYMTKRLILKILGEESAGLTTDFLVRNRDFFSPWEMAHSEEYYTIPYQRRLLGAEAVAFLHSQSVRYYLFLADGQLPIGSASFQNIHPQPDASCQLGYRLDRGYTGRGYMSEALFCLIPQVFRHYQLHRMEANVHPDNVASIRLMERMHFTLEGVARGRYQIGGKFQDHLRYSLLSDDFFPTA